MLPMAEIAPLGSRVLGTGLVSRRGPVWCSDPWPPEVQAAPIEEEIEIMAKLLLCAGIISLLAACSNMGTASDTATMGAAPGEVRLGGPLGASGERMY